MLSDILGVIFGSIIIIGLIVVTFSKHKGGNKLDNFTDYYNEESIYETGDWLEEQEETYIISKVTSVVNNRKTDWNGSDCGSLFEDYRIGLVNKNDILDTDVIVVSGDVYNPEIYKVGKEIKITKKVIAKY